MRTIRLAKTGRVPVRRTGVSVRGFVACALPAVVVSSAMGVSQLKHGSKPPPIALETLAGERLSLDDVRGRSAVIVFGELYHERTLRACGEIRQALASDALSGESVAVMLIIAQNAPRKELREQAKDPRLPTTVLHDAERAAYGSYRVTVMPSVVVVDGEGRVVHAISGYSSRFEDIVTDALLVAGGKLTRDRFQEMLHPPADDPIDDARVRAGRLASLAQQLARRDLDRMAEEKYAEALEAAPDHAPARLGLAMVLLRNRRLADAERQFRAALDVDPRSVEGSLGLAYVQTLRGGAELTEARDIVRGLLRDDPEEPRALYLLGLIHQQQGEADDAIAAFRKAAELLMSRRDSWNVIPGSLKNEEE